MSKEAPRKRARRIEADPRTDEFVSLFQQYGDLVLAHIAKATGRTIDPAILARVNREVEPMLRQRIEVLVKDYLTTAYESLTGEPIDLDQVGYRVQFPRRRRYHLRFLTLAFSDLVIFDEQAVITAADGGKARKGDSNPAIFPKFLLEGVDLWARQILDRGDIDAANQAAFQALDRLDISADSETRESDRDLWRRLHEFEDAMALVCPVLVPLLMPFDEDFEQARTQMQRAIGAGSENRVQLNAKMWDLLFARIFGRLMRIGGMNERPELAATIDDQSRATIGSVMLKYRKWRKDNQLK